MTAQFHQPKIEPLGDSAVTVTFGDAIDETIHQAVCRFFQTVEQSPFPWMIEAVPTYTGVAIHYHPVNVKSGDCFPFIQVKKEVEQRLNQMAHDLFDEQKERIVEIPVCYGGKYGPDLGAVADYHHISIDKVIKIHAERQYRVYMIGFAPGFPYLGGLSSRLATPRKQTPRVKIPQGSVGIAGEQTGVYPMESPGGWQLIGRTPIKLFRPEHGEPSLLKTGDLVQFVPIDKETFEAWAKDDRM